MLLVLGVILGGVIGLTLGLLGGGGSILTVPALVYLVGQSPQVAVTTSLAVVGTNSMMGAYFHSGQGTLNWRVAFMFGGAGMGVAYLAAGLSSHFSKSTMLTAFAALMLAVGALMLLYKRPEKTTETNPNWLVILGSGIVVGFLTGLLGVGGGFLIVPALVMLVGLPIQQAVGTSLVIIAMNSVAGLLGHLHGGTLDLRLTAVFIAAGLLGTLAGAKLGKRLPAAYLRQLFAIFVIGLAVLLLYDNVL
ncbi:MAG: sulfite exporter TauE/SafE family protein [Anaerolineales bacterium]|nr:sulfite exporter TauE/SafE family protein [Anaerolineales bacterium]